MPTHRNPPPERWQVIKSRAFTDRLQYVVDDRTGHLGPVEFTFWANGKKTYVWAGWEIFLDKKHHKDIDAAVLRFIEAQPPAPKKRAASTRKRP